MNVGCVKEIKNNEFRVGMTPDNAKEYIRHGHTVYVEAGAGVGSGFTDEAYKAAGVNLVDAKKVWEVCDMVIKVKEPLEAEYQLMRKDQIIYTYLHLAADKELTEAMLKCGCKGVAYETLTDARGALPLLKPMSEIAGRLSVIEGAKYLEKAFGGKGILISGVPGVRKAKVLVLGGGFVGRNAARMAMNMGADVTVMDINLNALTEIDSEFNGRIKTLYSTPSAIEKEIVDTDLVVGAVLIPGASAPKLIKKDYFKTMQPGSVVVDVAVDQGGCSETTRATTHDNPIFVVDGVVQYCVANMPGAVPYTATMSLTNATLSYGLRIADKGLESVAKADKGVANAINVYGGKCTFKGVSDALGIDYTDINSLI